MKRIFSYALAVALVLSSLLLGVSASPSPAPDSTPTPKEPAVIFSLEGLTLGQGLYLAPQAYSLKALATAIGADPDTLSAAQVTDYLLKQAGLEYQHGGTVDNNFYMSSIKDIDTGVVNIPKIIGEDGGPTNDDHTGNNDDYLGEFDYGGMSGWMYTTNHQLASRGASEWILKDQQNQDGTVVLRWQFTVHGFGSDLGQDFGGAGLYPAGDRTKAYQTYALLQKDYPNFGKENPQALAAFITTMEELTLDQSQVDQAEHTLLAAFGDFLEGQQPSGESYPIQGQTAKTLAYLHSTVPAPNFGISGGEWTVLALARGGYLPVDHEYFQGYYQRILTRLENQEGPKIDQRKSTENSRLILALSALGIDSTDIAGLDLTQPLKDYEYVVSQGINGPIFALLALNSLPGTLVQTSIAHQYLDFILEKEISGGGWALFGSSPDPDITSMTLQALAPYRSSHADVSAAVERGIDTLSSIQKEQGGFAGWGSVSSESIAQVITALSELGIDAHSDPRFVKNGNSAIDAFLAFAHENGGFYHIMEETEPNAMGTEQAAYALVAYQRLIQGEPSLYNMTDAWDSDTQPLPDGISLSFGVPRKISPKAGATFPITVKVSGWEDDEYKLMDGIFTLPNGVEILSLTNTPALENGTLEYHREEDGKLRFVYSDLSQLSDITLGASGSGVDILTLECKLTENILQSKHSSILRMDGASLKRLSDPSDDRAVVVLDTTHATVDLLDLVDTTTPEDYLLYAYSLYQGDGIDLIPDTVQAVAVATELGGKDVSVTYKDTPLLYNHALSEKAGVPTYVQLFSTQQSLEDLVKKEDYTYQEDTPSPTLAFGDTNQDGVINAQDALNTMNAWLRKSQNPQEEMLLAMNVNGDARINTFDSLAIAEHYVKGAEFSILSKVHIQDSFEEHWQAQQKTKEKTPAQALQDGELVTLNG